MTFERIETKKTSLLVIEKILGAIEEGTYQPGDRLPPERKIAEELGVSRTSVREALSALRLAKAIETRHGDGTYVNDSLTEVSNVKNRVMPIIEKEEDPFAVWEARESFERGIIPLAIERAEKEDIKQLGKHVHQMKNSAQKENYEDYFSSDRSFHLRMAISTHNPFIERDIRALVDVMKQKLWQEVKKEYFLEKNEGENIYSSVETHQKLFQAIKDRDTETALDLIDEHFSELGEFLQNRRG